MEVENSPKPPKRVRAIGDIGPFLERIEWALHYRDGTDGRRIFSMVALGLIRQHKSADGAGEEARMQRALTALFGEEPIGGRPRKKHEVALLRMADMHVNDMANRKLWEERRGWGIEKRSRPRIRGAEKLAEAAALAVYGEAGDSLVRRLKEEFNANRAQLLDLRQEILASGEVEKELASLILELLADRGLKMDPTVAEAAELFHIEELVE
jgi:hypothetical protein